MSSGVSAEIVRSVEPLSARELAGRVVGLRVERNLNRTIGSLGLTGKEEDQIVAFLKTLTDGYGTALPNGHSELSVMYKYR
jgi:hypothetical protein